jgi:hypothetical protein
MISTMPHKMAPRTRLTMPLMTRITARIHKMNDMNSPFPTDKVPFDAREKHAFAVVGYATPMTSKKDEEPIHAEGVPGEEDIDEADAVERLDRDPEEQDSFTETHPEEAARIRREARGEESTS